VHEGDRIRIDARARRLDSPDDDKEFPRGGRHGSRGRRGIVPARWRSMPAWSARAPGGAVTHDGAAEWPWFDGA